jgi:CBS domain-containing protein
VSRLSGTVASALLKAPKLCRPDVSTGEVRRLLADDHVHLVLLVDAGRLVTTIERGDIDRTVPDDERASRYGTLAERTIGPGASIADALDRMRTAGRRRLAVVDDDGGLRGLLCLKRHGRGFCSDADVDDRRGG